MIGGSLKIGMHDPGIQRSISNVKNDGGIDFLINKKTSVQESVKVSVFSRQEKMMFPDRELNSGLQISSVAC